MSEGTAVPADDAILMARYGIIQGTADQFRYKRYLYNSLRDAIAQARRDNPSS